MKRLLCTVMTAVMLVAALSLPGFAAAKYTSTWTLTAEHAGKSYNSSDTITVAPGETVYVTLSLSNNYLIGAVFAQIYYNSSIFSGAGEGDFNKDGKIYNACPSSFCTCLDWDRIHPDYRETCWPKLGANELKEFKANHHFLRITMTAASEVIGSVNEKLITIPFKVSSSAKSGTTGQIILPVEAMRTPDNRFGYIYCSRRASESITSDIFTYGSDMSADLTKAVLNFRVAGSSGGLGDVDANGTINSTDALLTLQSSVGKVNLSNAQKQAADVNKDKKINSTDALIILQYSVGTINKF